MDSSNSKPGFGSRGKRETRSELGGAEHNSSNLSAGPMGWRKKGRRIFLEDDGRRSDSEDHGSTDTKQSVYRESPTVLLPASGPHAEQAATVRPFQGQRRPNHRGAGGRPAWPGAVRDG